MTKIRFKRVLGIRFLKNIAKRGLIFSFSRLACWVFTQTDFTRQKASNQLLLRVIIRALKRSTFKNQRYRFREIAHRSNRIREERDCNRKSSFTG
ncbi:LOW QUALITY PROTEIN: hypothetical protein TorRG33x02_096640 [Trema orientale]|uniref:Ribosomal protein n=1 Tax=Trema orientale TaxID=63057 RepID=A0A2P5FA11_TREOI|nr:LOW QUALITY PROTEIN: hypothetical protein TorRG33x02_096640 [Trema orientale]